MKFDNLCIVFGEDHFNHLGMVRSLGEEGINPVVIVVGDTYSIIKSKYIKKIHKVNNETEGIHLLISVYGNEELKPFVFTGSDSTTALLNEHYDELKDKFYFYNCGEQGRLNHFMEKEVLNQLADECGVQVAKRELVKNGDLPKELRYPIITKAINSLEGGWKNTMHICNNEDELKEAYKEIPAKDILLQEYIVKKNELCIDAVCCNEGKDVFIPINSYYHRLFDKSYGNYYYFTKFDNPELLRKIGLMLQKARYTGIFSIEFLVGQDEQLYFLEINWRNSTWSHASTRAGYNLVLSWRNAVLNGYIDREKINIHKIPYSCMDEISEFIVNVCRRKVPFFQWIKEVRACDYLTYWDKNDMKPFWGRLKHLIIRKIKKNE